MKAIDLKTLAPFARELLSTLDVDGDGTLDLDELSNAAKMLAEYKVRRKTGGGRAFCRRRLMAGDRAFALPTRRGHPRVACAPSMVRGRLIDAREA